MTQPKKSRLVMAYDLLKHHKKMTALEIEIATGGIIPQSNAGHLLRELVALGNSIRTCQRKGRGTPFVYTFIPGTPPPISKASGRKPVAVVDKRERLPAERTHKKTPNEILLLDRITANWGTRSFDEETT